MDSNFSSSNQPNNTTGIIDYLTFDPTLIQPNIVKKSEKGRKTKKPLPKENRCSICLDFYIPGKEDSEPLISCTICGAHLHPSCYHLELGPIECENFTCERCRVAILYHQPIESYKCFICMESNGVLKRNPATGEFYHCLCLGFISELYEHKAEDQYITKSNIRKWRYKNSCRYCGEKLDKEKAVIKCNNPKCKGFFHIPCAIEKEMIFNVNYIYKYFSLENQMEENVTPFFCSCHNKRLIASYKNYFFNGNTNPNETQIKKNSEGDMMTIEEDLNDYSMKEIDLRDDSSVDDWNQLSDRTNDLTARDNGMSQDYFDNQCFCNNQNGVMALDFNEIEMEISKDNSTCFQAKEEQSGVNISPKTKIPLEFVYSQSYSP